MLRLELQLRHVHSQPTALLEYRNYCCGTSDCALLLGLGASAAAAAAAAATALGATTLGAAAAAAAVARLPRQRLTDLHGRLVERGNLLPKCRQVLALSGRLAVPDRLSDLVNNGLQAAKDPSQR